MTVVFNLELQISISLVAGFVQIDTDPAGAGMADHGPFGPSFAAEEVADVIEALLDVYRRERSAGEAFVDTMRRLGTAPLRAATDAVRQATAQHPAEKAEA